MSFVLLALLSCVCPQPQDVTCDAPDPDPVQDSGDTASTPDTGDCVSPVSWYADADGDGYGNAADSVMACDAPSARVLDATDCDDGDAAIHPAAEEICEDRRDNNCNGLGDEELDADGDGYLPMDACPHTGTDCDDGDAKVHPDAAETCGDGVDSDCDGVPTLGDGWYVGSWTVAAVLTTFLTEDTCSGTFTAFVDETVSPTTVTASGTCGGMDFEITGETAQVAFTATVGDDGALSLTEFWMALHNDTFGASFEGRLETTMSFLHVLEGSFSTSHSSSGSSYTYFARSTFLAGPCAL